VYSTLLLFVQNERKRTKPKPVCLVCIVSIIIIPMLIRSFIIISYSHPLSSFSIIYLFLPFFILPSLSPAIGIHLILVIFFSPPFLLSSLHSRTPHLPKTFKKYQDSTSRTPVGGKGCASCGIQWSNIAAQYQRNEFCTVPHFKGGREERREKEERKKGRKEEREM
jgi:hypothetical protein